MNNDQGLNNGENKMNSDVNLDDFIINDDDDSTSMNSDDYLDDFNINDDDDDDSTSMDSDDYLDDFNNNDDDSTSMNSDVNLDDSNINDDSTSMNSDVYLDDSKINNDVKAPNKLIKFGVIGVVVVIVGFIFSTFVLNHNDKNTGSSTTVKSLLDTNAFFIKSNTVDKYALFNIDGDRITDFIYDDVNNFYNGTALVKKDNKYGLINTQGKTVVDYDKYDYISTNSGGLYLVSNDKGDYLIDAKGKQVYTYKADTGEHNSFFGTVLYSYAIDENKIIVFNYTGKKMKEYTLNKEANSKGLFADALDDYFGDWNNQYSSIYYDGYLTIFDNNKFTEVFNGKVDYPYVLKLVAYDGQTFILGPVTYSDADYGRNRKIAMVYNNKFADLEYESITSGQMGNGTDYLKGKSLADNKDYYIKKDGSKWVLASNTYVLSENDYAISPSSSNTYVEFYSDGKKSSKIENAYLNDTGIKGNYLVHLKNDNYKLTWYDRNGNRVLAKSYGKLSLLDENNRATASDEKDSKEYLIDEKGNKISDEYDDIRLIHDYDSDSKVPTDYYSVELDGKCGVIDKNGNKIIDLKYADRLDTVSRVKVLDKDNIVVCANIDNEMMECYSTKKGVIISGKKYTISMEKNYIKYVDDKTKKIEYYAFNGKKFDVK